MIVGDLLVRSWGINPVLDAKYLAPPDWLSRVADMTAFFSISRGEEGARWGELIEYDATEKIFTAPSDKRTEDYVTGRFG